MDPETRMDAPVSSAGNAMEEANSGTPSQHPFTGLKLYITLFSLMVAGFLIVLDTSIVVTVRGSPSLASPSKN
jgi:hypothetical protein